MLQNTEYNSGHNKYIHEPDLKLKAATNMLKYVVYEFNYVRYSKTTTSTTYEVLKKADALLKQLEESEK